MNLQDRAERSFEIWLNRPFGDEKDYHGPIKDNIEQSCFNILKKAYISAYLAAWQDRFENSAEEQLQK